jgi:hypothetical protein
MNIRRGRVLRKLKPQLGTGTTPEIVFENNRPRPRIEPGIYRAYSCAAKGPYCDRYTGRWTVHIAWDVITDNFETIARDVPMFFNLGADETPRAGRSSKYFHEWCTANDGPPRRGDRTSPRVFAKRFARVLVRDTNRSRYDPQRAPAPYSVVDKVLEWETGSTPQEFKNSTIQERQQRKAPTSETCGETLPKNKAFILANEGNRSARAGVESQDKTTQGADGDKSPVRQRQDSVGKSLSK